METMEVKMTKQEIEAKVAALLQPEGPYDHDWLGLEVDGVCSKCKCKHGSKKADELPCDFPDKLTISDDPEDKAYEASMGKAVVMFRGLDISSYDAWALTKDMLKLAKCHYHESIIICVGTFRAWFIHEATSLEIWEIILKAKGIKDE